MLGDVQYWSLTCQSDYVTPSAPIRIYFTITPNATNGSRIRKHTPVFVSSSVYIMSFRLPLLFFSTYCIMPIDTVRLSSAIQTQYLDSVCSTHDTDVHTTVYRLQVRIHFIIFTCQVQLCLLPTLRLSHFNKLFHKIRQS